MNKTLLAVLGTLAILASGCKSENKIIDHVTFTPSDNLEVVRVSLVFASGIQPDFAGGFTLKQYGYLFINPFTPQQPFEIGFDLNTAIVNDQDYVRLDPTTVLPNGVPIGLDRALVEIRGEKPISPKFDLYGYVDVLRQHWLGVAAIFGFVDKYFPAGLSLSQVFLRSSLGEPAMIGSVFGPKLKPDGSVERAGGIAFFADVRTLIEEHTLKAGVATTFYPEKNVVLSGPAAPVFLKEPRKLLQLQRSFIDGLNGLR